MDDDQSTLRRMVWVFPDRESSRAVPKWQKAFWFAYEEVAHALGLTWTSHPPEDVAVDRMDHDDVRVYVAGERVTPADTLFVTSLYSLPYQAMDVFNQYALYAVLEQTGFYLPAPPFLSSIVNDKLATILYFKDSPIPAVPTIRIGTGRDLGHRLYEPVLEKLTFPAIVKPTGWCAGWGICMAHNLEDLRGLLSLAQGGETTLAIQPYLGRNTIDFRVFMVDGRPHTVARRTPPAGAYVANFGRGGGLEYVPLPTELADAMDYFAEKIPIPFVCVDFLFDGERYWFSEIEPDGAIVCPDHDSPAVVRRQRSIIEARFRAYRRGHAQWVGDKVKEISYV
jgi:glutathione synthase/RimK-type ligase-like ATP-grasp enzyme